MLMKERATNFLLASLATVMVVGAFFVGKGLSADTQLELYGSLRATSAIVFGIMGAWIAIIYPESLSKIYRSSQRSDAESEVKNIARLLKPMIIAAVIVGAALIAEFSAPVLKSISALSPFYLYIRGFSFALLVFLLGAQLITIFEVMLINYSFKRKVRSKQAEDSFEKGFVADKTLKNRKK